MSSYIIYCDGASRGNGTKHMKASIGSICYDNCGNTIFEISELVGKKTNNESEYMSLISSLNKFRDLKLNGSLTIKMDSLLVVNQVLGLWKVNKHHLADLKKDVLSIGVKYELIHIKREFNAVADALANKAYD